MQPPEGADLDAGYRIATGKLKENATPLAVGSPKQE